MQKTEDYLKKLLEELEAAPDDKQHFRLVRDLSDLLKEAIDCEFHDFKNEKYAAPKMELRLKLLVLVNKVENGYYDN